MDSTQGVDSMAIPEQSSESQVLITMMEAKSRGPQRLQEVEDPLVDQNTDDAGALEPKVLGRFLDLDYSIRVIWVVENLFEDLEKDIVSGWRGEKPDQADRRSLHVTEMRDAQLNDTDRSVMLDSPSLASSGASTSSSLTRTFDLVEALDTRD